MTTKLSTFFTLEEMLFSQYAANHEIVNIPNGVEFLALQSTAIKMDDVRRLLTAPIFISSGFRCAELNKGVRGSPTSDHMRGLAVDFTAPGYGSVQRIFARIRASSIKFDQLILERNEWVHMGFGPQMRGEVLVYEGGVYREIK